MVGLKIRFRILIVFRFLFKKDNEFSYNYNSSYMELTCRVSGLKNIHSLHLVEKKELHVMLQHNLTTPK